MLTNARFTPRRQRCLWGVGCLFASLLTFSAPAQVVDQERAYEVYESVLRQEAKVLRQEYGRWGTQFIVSDTVSWQGLLRFDYHNPIWYDLAADTNKLYTDPSWQAFLQDTTRLDTSAHYRLNTPKFKQRGYHLLSRQPNNPDKVPVSEIQFSPVIFSKDYRKAAVYYEFSESGHFMYLEKKNGKWQEVAHYMLWIA